MNEFEQQYLPEAYRPLSPWAYFGLSILYSVPEMDGAIDTFLRRKLDGRTLDAKQIKKTVDALLRRGHSYHDIQAGLRRYEASLSLEQTQEDTWEDME